MSFPGTFNWNDKAVELLKHLWITEKLTGSEIANRLGGGLSRSAVMGKISRLGLPARTVGIRAVGKGSGHPRPYSRAPRKRWTGVDLGTPGGDLTAKVEGHFDGKCRVIIDSIKLEPEHSKNWLITDFPDDPRDPKFCRYAVTHTMPYRFCGNATEDGESWCPVHRKLVTIVGSGKAKAPGKQWMGWS